MQGSDQQPVGGEVVGLTPRESEPITADDRAYVLGLVLVTTLDTLMARGVLEPADVARILDYVQSEFLKAVGEELQGKGANARIRQMAAAVRQQCAHLRAMIPAIKGL